jgi:hypothetical protein
MTTAALSAAPALAWLDALEAALALPDDANVPPELSRQVVARVQRCKARLSGREMAHVRNIENSAVPRLTGCTSTGDLLAGDFGGDRQASSRMVRTAKNLASASLTETALSDGQITLEKADIIAKAMAGLPSGLGEFDRARVEKKLISDAKLFTLSDLRRRVLRIADLYADKATADRDENETLRLQEARAWANTELWMGPARDGLVKGGFAIPEAQAAILKNQIDAISAPRRRSLDNEPDGSYSTSEDELTYGQRLGRAFCHWIERIPVDRLPTTGGTPATLTVNLDFDDITSQVAPATLGDGTRISASEVRRMACGVGILPRVLDGKSEVLDQGRAKRLFTPAQRIAMADRDGGCTYPGCDRPPGWSEAHHLDHWAAGGNTDLNRGALLCARHHHWVHAEGLQGRVQGGKTRWRIDGIWQTNHRWRP